MLPKLYTWSRNFRFLRKYADNMQNYKDGSESKFTAGKISVEGTYSTVHSEGVSDMLYSNTVRLTVEAPVTPCDKCVSIPNAYKKHI
jgi:hypothetical protein